MAMGFVPIEHYRTKFYQKENQSKRFSELTEENLANISKKIYKKEEIAEDTKAAKLDRYIKTLLYLTNPNIHFDLKTYDERLAYLILATDPELITFKEFLKIHLPSISSISNIENQKERTMALEERHQILQQFETAVREQIGFYDVKLLKFEEQFFKRFYSKKELITQVGQHNEDGFLLLAGLVDSFDNITDERFKELIETAQAWNTIVPDKHKTKTATYSATKQKDLLGLTTLTEQFAFYILAVDPNLDMLRIYEEESMIPTTQERIEEAFGYYNPALITLEKKYHQRFCPDKKVSIWTETK